MHNETLYQNPIIPGFAPDPSIVHVDGVFYLVTPPSHSPPGLPIYASRDLKGWTHIGNAINRPEQLSLYAASTKCVPLDTSHSMVASGGLFAPTIKYHRGVFYIVCTNAGHGGKTLRTDNFVISSIDIWSSNWSDPIPIPFKGIDPGLFFDDDGRVYFHGCFLLDRTKQPSCTITQFEVDIETGAPISEQREIWQGHARYDTEGPHIYKLGKWYYLLVAEGGTSEHHMLCISRSESVWGPYEDFKGNPILTADGKGDEYIQNTGHGDLFQDANGQWWAVVLGVRNEKSCQPLGRETFLTPVDWPEGGWPVIAQPRMEFTGLVATSFSKRNGKGMDAASRWIPPARVEDLFIRDPDLSRYKLPDTGKGPYILFPSQSGLSTPMGTSTFIGRRQRSLNSTATTLIGIATTGAVARHGIKVGLTVYKDHMRHVSLSYDFDAREVVCHAWNASTGLDRTSTTTLQVRETAETEPQDHRNTYQVPTTCQGVHIGSGGRVAGAGVLRDSGISRAGDDGSGLWYFYAHHYYGRREYKCYLSVP